MKPPCKLDHNGECLVCDCWICDCQWVNLWAGKFTHYTLEEMLVTFKDYLTEEEVRILRERPTKTESVSG